MDTPLEQDISLVHKHWRELSDLTISEAAFWMVIGSDPHAHQDRLSEDESYANYFDNHPGGSKAVEKGCEVIFSAIRDGRIKTTEEIRSGNHTLTTRTNIRKSDWINWCRDNGYPELANDLGPGPEDSQSIAAKTEGVPVPGKMPRTAAGKLAVKAAWEIECATGKQATAKQVIARLEEWINAEPILLERIPHGIRWMTTNSEEADFTLDACAKALSKWKATRP